MDISVQIEKPSNITRKLKVVIPAATVTQRFQTSLQRVQKTAKIKGFRPGMVPLSIVQKTYGEDVRHSLFHDLIEESYRQALRDQKLRAVGSPQIDTSEHNTGTGAHDHSLPEGRDLVFTATVEVIPELEVKSYSGLSLTQESSEVKDADVQKVIEGLREHQAQLIPAEGAAEGKRLVQMGDTIDLQFKGGLVTPTGIEERPGMSGNRMLEVGSQTFIPGFEEQLVGMKAGETKAIRVTFPADYMEKDFASKEAEFTVTAQEIKVKQLPELNDEFAKDAGYASLEEMKAKATEHLAGEKKRESERKLKSDLLQTLIEKNPFDVPQALIQAQTRTLAQDVANNLKREGFPQNMIEQTLASEMESLVKRAENQVRASLLLEAIARQEKIALTPEELEAEIESIAAGAKMKAAEVREFYAKNPNRQDDLEFRMLEDKTVKFLLSKSKIKGGK